MFIIIIISQHRGLELTLSAWCGCVVMEQWEDGAPPSWEPAEHIADKMRDAFDEAYPLPLKSKDTANPIKLQMATSAAADNDS